MFKMLFVFLIPASLLAQINSSYDEQSPVLHPSLTELYFTVAAHPLNVSGKRDAGDIWVSKKNGDTWGKPELVSGLVNNGGYNAVLGFSADGNDMYVYGHYTAVGNVAGSQGIAVSKRSGNTWSLPKNETIPYFLNRSIASGGHVTADKQIFVFSAEGRAHDSFGNEDIYVSFNRDGVWTEPLNVGATINTANQELSPFYDVDQATLYFSSNKPNGLGSFDVYVSTRLDDSWQLWSEPKRESTIINTAGRELYFRITETGSLHATTWNSDGYGDIKEIQSSGLPEQTKQKVVVRDSTIVTTPPQNRLMLTGMITDALTGQGIVASMEFKSVNQQTVTSKPNGAFDALLPQGANLSVTISATGYLTRQETITLLGHERAYQVNFRLQPVAVGVLVNLKHVLFRQSSPELLPESYDELDAVVSFLKDNPRVEIELSGHTDAAGKASLNIKLSRERANRVKYYLVEKGISANRITSVGYGGKKPIASNKTDEGRKLNRRVEFKIVKK